MLSGYHLILMHYVMRKILQTVTWLKSLFKMFGTVEIHTNYNDQVRLITLSSIYADVSDRCKPTKKRKLCESVVPK